MLNGMSSKVCLGDPYPSALFMEKHTSILFYSTSLILTHNKNGELDALILRYLAIITNN